MGTIVDLDQSSFGEDKLAEDFDLEDMDIEDIHHLGIDLGDIDPEENTDLEGDTSLVGGLRDIHQQNIDLGQVDCLQGLMVLLSLNL